MNTLDDLLLRDALEPQPSSFNPGSFNPSVLQQEDYLLTQQFLQIVSPVSARTRGHFD